MAFWKRMSLKFKILTLTLGLTTFLGLSAAYLVRELASTSKASILDTFGAYANSLQASIAAQFYERYGDVQAFALNPVMQTKNRSEIVGFLNTYSAMYGIYDLIMVVDVEGNLVAVNGKAPDGKELKVESLYRKNFSSAPWFEAVTHGRFTEDKERGYAGTYVEDAHMDPIVSEAFGEKRFGTGFSAPIKDANGALIGVITNRAGSRWFENEFLNLYSAMKKVGLTGTELTLVSKDGTLLVDFDPSFSNGELKHDFEKVGKFNLAKAGLDIAGFLQEGKEGKLISMHARKKIDMATGYMPVNDRKFIPSIGWGVIVRTDAKEAFRDVQWMENFFYFFFAALSAIAAALSYFFSESLAKTLKAVADRLANGAKDVLSNSENVATASASLSSSASEQAASLQQTVASTDEVSSMVAKNADNAKKSQEASSLSQEAVEKGKLVVKEMIDSINEINLSNTQIMEQIETSNREISEIVRMINDIGNKTKVINDIVFQTKLLSFNASVEAARAGEHGKGFAVVAEEVGNLASMSGNSAMEISSMLDGSIQRVEGIVNNTKAQVERLVASGKEKVEKGMANAHRCSEVLEEIVLNVTSVNRMVGEIAAASQEQAQGVGEITKAMNQLDEVTQQNATASQQCSTASEQLRFQANALTSIVSTLLGTVQGQKEQAANFALANASSEEPKAEMEAETASKAA